MTGAVGRLIPHRSQYEQLLIKVAMALASLGLLLGCALECMHMTLGRGWLDTAWGLANGAVMSAALTEGLSCQRALHKLQMRVVPVALMHASVQRSFQNLVMICFIGLGYLVLIGHLPIEAPEVMASPWTLPAFVWLGTPLYILAAMAWHQAWSWWFKTVIWCVALTYVAMHKAVALTWGINQGTWLVWGLFLGGAAGLLCVRHALLKTVAVSWRSGPQWWTWWRSWNQYWSERAPLVNPGKTWLLSAVSYPLLTRHFNHPDFPESLVSNAFWSTRVIFLVVWLFTLLRSERTHWRWQMLPGSGFRMRLGSEMAKCTARCMAMDLTIGVTLFAVIRWCWVPYDLMEALLAVQLLTWPLLVDLTFALCCAVWLRSVHWRSAPDMTALFGLLLVIGLAFNPRFLGARTWLQDTLMLSVAWLMVQRANHNFETSNWSWLTTGRNLGWWVKVKGS